MVKEKLDKGIDDIKIKEELKKTPRPKKKAIKKKKTKEEKKEKKINKKIEKKELKSTKKENKKTKKKRKLNKLNTIIILLSFIFIICGIIGVLYGVEVIDFKLKDPGPKYYDLSKKVNIGDYVDYDADYWEDEKEIPNRNSQFTFGGYKVSTSRNNGVTCNYNEVENKGWRVFGIEEDNVTLIQAGLSMCYYHGYGNLTNDVSVNILSNLDENNKFDYFKDEKFSESVRMLSKEDIDKYIEGDSSYSRISDDLINVGNPYWLATKNGTHYMWYVTEGGTVAVDHVGVYGVRVLVTLKQNVKTTGQDKKGVWVLSEGVKKDE